MILAFRLARRELRAGVRGLWIVLACLALGVAAIAAVGTLREGVARGLAEDGRRILGGDLEIQGGVQPLPESLRDWLRGRGAQVSDIVTLRSMLVAPSGARMLVEAKAVDDAWPLVDHAEFVPGQRVADAIGARGGQSGIVTEALVASRLDLHPGDTVRMGNATLVWRGLLTEEPDRVATPSILGPRVLIGTDALRATGLLQPGAIVEHHLRVLLPPGADVPATVTAVRAAFPDTGWRIRDTRAAAPQVTQFIEQTSLFMTLVGLTSLLVGGIGVANGVRAWLEARAGGIATLRCLGAPPRLVFAICLIQVMALACLGVAAGLVAGVLLPLAAVHLLADVLPVPPRVGIFPAPLGLAAAYGVLTAAAFALWPLARALRISGAALFRDTLLPAGGWPPRPLLALNLALALALIGLTVAASADPGFALGFCGVALATLAIFRAGGWLLMRLAARLRPPSAWARLGIGNLHRPGAATPLMLVSVGLGLTTLTAVALVQGNVERQVLEQMPDRAPSFFFVDIQNDQLPRFRALVEATPGTSDLREVPSLRARMVALNGVPVDRVTVSPETAWALRGDRGLTYAAAMPDGTRLTDGAWWPPGYTGKPLVSFDANLAKGWGVKVGDTLRVNVLGRDVDLTIANLRRIEWRTLGINFTLIASPGLMEHAPHTHIATVRAEPMAQSGLLQAVTDAFPNVSGIRVADVLAAVAVLLGQIAGALAATGSLTLVSGALVLAGAVAAGQRRRVREAVILKSLGATRAQIRAAWLVEFGALGAAAGLIAACIGTAASWGVVHFVMHTDWAFLPGRLAVTVLSCMALMLAFGYAGTAAALRAKAAPLLRNE